MGAPVASMWIESLVAGTPDAALFSSSMPTMLNHAEKLDLIF